MLKYNCLITIFLLALVLWSRPGDTMNYYRLKGIDVTVGKTFSYLGERAHVNLLKAISPPAYSSYYNNYDKAILYGEDACIDPVKVGVGIVFGNNQRNNQYFVNKHEVMFKFSFETKQAYNRYKNIQLPLYSGLSYNRDTAEFNYTYQTQTIGLGYQLSTKSFLKNLALFGGVTADFGMVTIKQIKEIRFRYSSTVYDIKNYNTTLLRGNAILGIKYNFSCDINFFLQGEFGMLHYGNAIGTNATYIGFSFGIRYKFLEDQDKLRYNSTGFW